MLSGGPIESNGLIGWAMHPFVGSSAHYWEEGVRNAQVCIVITVCGIETHTTPQIHLLDRGSFPKCGRCKRILGDPE